MSSSTVTLMQQWLFLRQRRAFSRERHDAGLGLADNIGRFDEDFCSSGVRNEEKEISHARRRRQHPLHQGVFMSENGYVEPKKLVLGISGNGGRCS